MNQLQRPRLNIKPMVNNTYSNNKSMKKEIKEDIPQISAFNRGPVNSRRRKDSEGTLNGDSTIGNTMESGSPNWLELKGIKSRSSSIKLDSSRRSSLKNGRNSRERNTGSPSGEKRVKFDTKRNEYRLVSPINKVIFDWEIMPPNDTSEDPEHDEIMSRVKKDGMYKEQEELKKHEEKETPSESPPRITHNNRDLPKLEFEKPPEPLPNVEKVEESIPDDSPNKVETKIDMSQYGLLKKAIEDNRCSKEEWVTFRKQFRDLKGPLSEGITVKKYGRRNFFKADQRRFFFIDNFTKFTWSKEQGTTYDKLFKVEDVQTIKLGKETENLKRFGSANEKLCFSVVMKDRTIDLEFKDQQQMRVVYFGLRFFYKIHHRFKKNLYLYESLNDDFPLEVFDEVDLNKSNLPSFF